MEEFTSRKATLADLKALTELVNEAYKIEIGDTGVAFKNCDRLPGDSELEDRIKNEEAAVIVAEQGGKYAGCIVAYPNGKEIHFGPFAVKPEFQGKGVGRFLLAKVEGLARERGFESVGLEIVDHRTDLVAFYEKLGFKLVGSGFFPPEIQSRLTRESKYLIYEKKLAAEKK